MQWYYIIDGERLGPVDEQKIASMLTDGTIGPDTKVWNESFGTEWRPVSSIGTPPPLPAQKTNDPVGRQTDDGISCTKAVTPAFERMKDILFRPFDMAKWFALGFSAFLATLGQGGGNGSGGSDSLDAPTPDGEDFDLGGVIEAGLNFIEENPWFIPLVIGIVIFILVLGIFFTWLKSRGRFMFLDNVVTNRDRISEPWKEFKTQANSLFLWSIGYGFVCIMSFSILAALSYFTIIKQCIEANAFDPSVIPAIIGISLASLLLMIVFGYVSRFLEDFVVPIMYKHNLSATAAWGSFLKIMKPAKGSFLLYGLFYLLLMAAASMGILMLVLLTCCIALCPLAIPYIGSVMLLPITVFFRAYSIEYLAQFGEQYDVYTNT